MTLSGSLRQAALTLLRLITRGRSIAPLGWLVARLPTALKVRVKQSLIGVAAGTPWTPALSLQPSAISELQDIPLENAIPCNNSGVNLIGYVRGGLGLAENVRSFARALSAVCFPFTLIDANVLAPDRNIDNSLAINVSTDAKFDVDLYFVNPDQLHAALQTLGSRSDHYRIGYWFWELERVPDEWIAAIDLVDEIWVSSRFVQKSFSQVTAKPVILIPMAVEIDEFRIGSMLDDRRDQRVFTFLFGFDFHSYIERKNPVAIIDAFRAAFPADREDVRLVLKSINGDIFQSQFYELIEYALKDPRIVIQDGFISRKQMIALMASADAYVSLHRSEGFGLGLAESMCLGKPVIGTAYSGNLEFMTPDNSCLVDYVMTEVKPGDYMHGEGQCWAAPDINDAARHMRKLVDDPAYATALGARAAVDMRALHSRAQCSQIAISRLRQICRQRDSGTKHEVDDNHKNKIDHGDLPCTAT